MFNFDVDVNNLILGYDLIASGESDQSKAFRKSAVSYYDQFEELMNSEIATFREDTEAFLRKWRIFPPLWKLSERWSQQLCTTQGLWWRVGRRPHQLENITWVSVRSWGSYMQESWRRFCNCARQRVFHKLENEATVPHWDSIDDEETYDPPLH